MQTCNVCGDPIVIRYVDGQSRPIHIYGNRCRGYRDALTRKERGRFRSVESYVVPDATCPVCGATVFYYQSPHGGRVFFDDLGWPWPKHPCTDNKQEVGRPTTTKRYDGPEAFRARDRSRLALYGLDGDGCKKSGPGFQFTFRLHGNPRKRLSGFLHSVALKKRGLTLDDFLHAPSFVVNLDKSGANGFWVDFICARLDRIVQVRMSKARS